jgi:cold shock CspA family protein
MRTHGTVTAWNGEKGYGFITPSAGAKQVFVRISAFSNRVLPPRVGQLVTFSLSTDRRGRIRGPISAVMDAHTART